MMLQLEFVHRRVIPWRGLLCLAIALGCAGVLLTDSLALQAAAQRDGERIAQQQQALKERRRAALQQQTKSDPQTQRRQKEQDKVVAALRYPWTRVLATIEQADSNDVALLSLSHEQAGGQTQILAEALDHQGLVRLVDALNDGNEVGNEDGNAVGAGADGGNHWYLSNYQLQPQNNPQTVKGTVLNK